MFGVKACMSSLCRYSSLQVVLCQPGRTIGFIVCCCSLYILVMTVLSWCVLVLVLWQSLMLTKVQTAIKNICVQDSKKTACRINIQHEDQKYCVQVVRLSIRILMTRRLASVSDQISYNYLSYYMGQGKESGSGHVLSTNVGENKVQIQPLLSATWPHRKACTPQRKSVTLSHFSRRYYQSKLNHWSQCFLKEISICY